MQKGIAYKLFIIIALIGIVYVFAQLFNSHWSRLSSIGKETREEQPEKLNIERLVVQSFEAKKELITSEAELFEEITWDESWGSIGLFKKKQAVRFYGIGLYTCDLNEITASDIAVDEKDKVITVTIPSPKIKSVTIDEARSEYKDVEKGWLRFGNIKLSQEEYGAMYGDIKTAMEAKLAGEEYYARAEKNSMEAVRQIFDDILRSIGQEYSVVIRISEE